MEDGSPPHNDQSGMINLELHSGRKMFNLIKPFAGFLGTNENAYYAYGGFGIDGYYGKKKNFVVTPSLACGYYKDGNEIKAGNPLEFYIGIDMFYRFKNNTRIEHKPIPVPTKDFGFFEAIHKGKPIARTSPTITIPYPKYKITSTRSNNIII